MKKHDRLHDIVRRLMNESIETRKHHETRGDDKMAKENDCMAEAYSNVLCIIESLWDYPEDGPTDPSDSSASSE